MVNRSLESIRRLFQISPYPSVEMLVAFLAGIASLGLGAFVSHYFYITGIISLTVAMWLVGVCNRQLAAAIEAGM